METAYKWAPNLSIEDRFTSVDRRQVKAETEQVQFAE